TLPSAALLDTASMGHGGIFQSRCLASCGGEPAHSSIPQCACGLGPAGIPSFSADIGRTLVYLPHYGILGQARCTRALVFVGLLGRNPLISNPALPFVGWLLLLHAVLPKAPYGSWEARSRDDPRGNWHMPQSAFALAWILMAAAYSYSGYTKLVSPSWVDGSAFTHILENPLARPTALRGLLLAMPPVSLRIATWTALALELTFVPLALLRRARPWIWTAMVGLHAGLLLLVSFADLTAGMLLVHLFTFNPAWLRPRTADRSAWIFYDGHCALCQGWVRFALAEDTDGKAFRISPLQGRLFATRIPAEKRHSLPDSLVVLTEDELLARSAAVLHVLRSLGGLWRIIAATLAVVPPSVLDWFYD